MPFRSLLGTRAGGSLASLLAIGVVAAGLWLHRIEHARPESQRPGPQVDAYLYYYPTAVFVHDELRSGRLPLWNPYQMAGQPTLALHLPAVLYPPNLLLLGALPPRLALPALAVLHVFLAGFFTWLFAGRLGLGPEARLVAAGAFMLSPSLLLGFYMPPFLATPVWLPAALWAIHGLASDARPRWALAVGASLGLSFLGGHTQAFVYVCQLAALYGLFALGFVAGHGQRLRVCALACGAGVLAFAIAAPQLLPALELARDGVRGLEGLTLQQVGYSSVTRPMIPRGWLGSFSRWVMPVAVQPALVLPLALCGAFARRQRAHWVFFVVMFGVLALFITGSRSAVFRLYHQLPLGDLFRLPYRAAFAYSLYGALLAAIGADVLVRRLGATRAPARLAAALGLLLAAGVTADRYASAVFDHAHPVVGPPFEGAPPALVGFLRKQPPHDRVFLERTSWFDPRAVRKAGSMHRLPFVPDYEPNMPGDYARFFGLEDKKLWHGDLQVTPGIVAPTDPRLLDLMSVRYYASARPAPRHLRERLREIATRRGPRLEGAEVSQRPSALPRLYTVRRARTVPDLDAALRELEAEDFDPRAEAVLIDPDGGAHPSRPGPGPRRADRVDLDEVTPRRVAARADCAARCLLVLTDLYHPDWRLRVDGEDRPVRRVNGIFRGVWLEPGKHEVVYFYRPGAFRAGLAVLGATTLLLGAAAYSVHRRRRGP